MDAFDEKNYSISELPMNITHPKARQMFITGIMNYIKLVNDPIAVRSPNYEPLSL